jgi:hypothetical protein
MKYIFKVLLWFIIFHVLFLSTYAIDAPSDVRITESWDTSIMIDWLDVPWNLGYYLYYGETTAVDGDYDVEGVDLIEKSEFLLEWLQPETEYFLSVTAVDEFVNEWEFSEEISFITSKIWTKLEATSLRIQKVIVINTTSIELTFSKILNTKVGAVRDFILENKESWEEVIIDASEVDEENPTKVIVILKNELQVGQQYELTIFDIQDTNGGTIELGIDAFITFDVPELSNLNTDVTIVGPTTDTILTTEPTSWPIENSSSGSLQNPRPTSWPIINSSTDTILTTGPTSWPKMGGNTTMPDSTIDMTSGQYIAGKTIEWNNAGQNISISELASNTLVAASQSDKLPNTGPEHWILVFLAFLLAAGFYYKSKN